MESNDYNDHLNDQDENKEDNLKEEFSEFPDLDKDSSLIDPDNNGEASRSHEINLELIEIIKYGAEKKKNNNY